MCLEVDLETTCLRLFSRCTVIGGWVPILAKANQCRRRHQESIDCTFLRASLQSQRISTRFFKSWQVGEACQCHLRQGFRNFEGRLWLRGASFVCFMIQVANGDLSSVMSGSHRQRHLVKLVVHDRGVLLYIHRAQQSSATS